MLFLDELTHHCHPFLQDVKTSSEGIHMEHERYLGSTG
jgi:hypothetical protein